MCVPKSPLFQRCQVYDWPPFFNKNYMNGPIFLDSYVKGPIFLTSWYMHIFFAQRFFEAAYPLGVTWIDYDICVITGKNGYKKSKGTIWIGQHFGWSSIWMGPFFRRPGIWNEWGRFWNTGSHTRTKITPKLCPPPPPHTPPPPPPHPAELLPPAQNYRIFVKSRSDQPIYTMEYT